MNMLINNILNKTPIPAEKYKTRKAKQMLKTAEKNMNYSRLKENNKELNLNLNDKEGVIYERNNF